VGGPLIPPIVFSPLIPKQLSDGLFMINSAGYHGAAGLAVLDAAAKGAKVVGIFPNTASLVRLFTAVLQDQHDEWQDGRRHFSQQSMARLLHPDGPPLLTNPLTEGLAA
jgi:Transposase, Mutator family